MNDFSWQNITWIRPGEGYILAMVIVAHLVLLFLIDQKKFPKFGRCLEMIAPWVMVYWGARFTATLFAFYNDRSNPSVAICFCGELTLAFGLIYAVRGRNADGAKFSGCLLRCISLSAAVFLIGMIFLQILATPLRPLSFHFPEFFILLPLVMLTGWIVSRTKFYAYWFKDI